MSDKKVIQPNNWSEPSDSQAPSRHLDQVAELRAQAQAGGLSFIVYLPPAFADWLLDQIEDGLFADPKEAMFALVGFYRESEPITVTREQLLRYACQAMCLDNPSLTLPKNFTEHVEDLLDAPPAKSAIWRE